MKNDRRDFIRRVMVPGLAAAGLGKAGLLAAARAQNLDMNAIMKRLNTPPPVFQPRTTISIEGNQFLINGEPTYKGRTFQDHKIEGLLFESRMVNAIIDDLNLETRGYWAYPDGPWDPERNTREFVANFPLYRSCGLTAVAFNVQGGSPMGYGWHQPWHTSGFDTAGGLRPDYRDRMLRVIEAADANGMVAILGMFYIASTPALADEAAVIRAVDEVTEILCARGYTNVLIEIGNEVNIPRWAYEILKPQRAHELIERIQKNSTGKLKTLAGRLLVTTNAGLPPESMFAVADYITLHGNGDRTPDALRTQVRNVRGSAGYRNQPVLFTEDDHFDFDKPDNDMLAAVGEYAGWGLFDYRQVREGYAEGYQSLPVNWGISSARKKGFFSLLAQITGGQAPA